MNWLVPTIAVAEIFLLLYAAAIDVATRLIYNEVCLAIACFGLFNLFVGSSSALESLIATAILSTALLIAHQRGWIGGGDVKLLIALAIGLNAVALMRLLTITALAGGVLAAAHLVLRRLPAPRLAPAGASVMRRICQVERWRNVRNAPLPYGAAIACGGIWTLIDRGL